MKTNLTGLLAFVLLLGIASSATATSYQPGIYHRVDRIETMKKGDTVYLFYSGTDDSKALIHSGDEMSVYRTGHSCESKDSGRIKIVALIGDYYIKAEVVDGEIRVGDIAKKGHMSCIVITVDECAQ